MSTDQPPPDLSIVITCFNEEQSIDEFCQRLLATLRRIEGTSELVFVDDGSVDRTFEKLTALFQSEPLVRAVVRLFANSGQAAAITAGLTMARGQHLVLMDSDLQLDPEDLPQLVARFRAGNDVVSGFRVGRQDPLRRRVYSWIANTILRRVCGVTTRDFGCTFKVIDGRLLRAFEFGPRRVFRVVQVLSRAARVAEVPVTHRPRRYGSSGWTFARLLDLNTDNVVTLIKRPFQYLAIASAVGGALLVLRVLLDVFYPVVLMREVTHGLLLNVLAVSFLVLAAVQALIGELVIRSFDALRDTPAYVIRETIARAATGSADCMGGGR